MNPNEPVSLTLTVGEWRDLLAIMDDDAMSFGEVWDFKTSLERQLDEIVAAVDAKEKP